MYSSQILTSCSHRKRAQALSAGNQGKRCSVGVDTNSACPYECPLGLMGVSSLNELRGDLKKLRRFSLALDIERVCHHSFGCSLYVIRAAHGYDRYPWKPPADNSEKFAAGHIRHIQIT